MLIIKLFFMRWIAKLILIGIVLYTFTPMSQACPCGWNDLDDKCNPEPCDNPDFSESKDVNDIVEYVNKHGATKEHLNSIPSDKRTDFFHNADPGKVSKDWVSDNMKYMDSKDFHRYYTHSSTTKEDRDKMRDHMHECKGKKDYDFWKSVYTPESEKEFWENYQLGDITAMFKGMSFEEILAAVEVWLDGEGTKQLGEVPPAALQQALANQGLGVASMEYPDETQIIIDEGSLMINGNIIELESLETGSYDIAVDEQGNVKINDVTVSDATLAAEGLNIYVYDGDFSTATFSANDAYNFTIRDDGTLSGDWVDALTIYDLSNYTSSYTNLDLKDIQIYNASGIDLFGSYMLIDSAQLVLIIRWSDATNSYLTATLEDVQGLRIYADGTYEFNSATALNDEFRDLSISNANDAKLDSLGNFYVASVQQFNSGAASVYNATNLEFIPEGIHFIYDVNNNIVSIDAADYTLRAALATFVKVGDLNFTNIADAELTIANGDITKGKVTSTKDDNGFVLLNPFAITVDSLDAGESVSWDATSSPLSMSFTGEITAGFLNLGYFRSYAPTGDFYAWFKPNNVEYIFHSGLLVIDKISSEFEDMLSCPINLSCNANVSYRYGFECGEFQIGGFYQFNHTIPMKSFRLTAKQNRYSICIRKVATQHYSIWDSLADLFDKDIISNERVMMMKLLGTQMESVYYGRAGDTATMNLSGSAEYITNISIERTSIDTRSYYGYFNIIEENSTRYVKVAPSMIAPKIIYQYQTFNYTDKMMLDDDLNKAKC